MHPGLPQYFLCSNYVAAGITNNLFFIDQRPTQGNSIAKQGQIFGAGLIASRSLFSQSDHKERIGSNSLLIINVTKQVDVISLF